MPENKPHDQADAVLSSVRRIVRRGDDAPGAEEGEGDGKQPSEKLLLTPALRIDPDPDLPPERPRVQRTRVQTRTLTAERLSLEARIAELEQAVGDTGDWEPDGSEPGDPETPTAFVFGGGAAPETTLPPVEDAQSVADSLPDEDTLDLQGRPQPASAGKRPEDSEPAVFQTERVTVRAMPEPAPEPEREPRIDAVQQPAQEADKPNRTAVGEDLVIDEETLRGIVAEIVRSELQGELGERITRNVRKLVRREIHRAIMTRNLG